MKTTIQIKSIFGKLLFEFEKEDNSIKETVLEALKYGADLSGADLSRANLYGADLSGADLSRADLSGADLYGADLYRADLSRANLSGADLSGANLSGANLSRANLYGADLYRADLSRADLSRANLERIASLNSITPEGDLIVWKKLQGNLIAKLLIPTKAKRVNAIGSRKCRFEFAQVIAIYDGKKKVKKGLGTYNSVFIYKTGEVVTPDSFDPSPLIECSHGIHAFITKLEAQEYN